MSPKTTSDSYILEAEGIRVTILTYGAVIQNVFVKDKDGKERDVVLGFDTPEEYAAKRSFEGTIIGRYGNRIGKGRFTIDGKEYNVPLNEAGRTALHGGNNGYDRVNWTVESSNSSSITLSYLDPAGSEGFPGAVKNGVTYTVSSNPARLTLKILSHSLDERTPIMPTTHTYWNLSGFETSNILKDTLHMPNASRYIATDEHFIPTGETPSVTEQPYLDFTSPRVVEDNSSGHFEPNGAGIDHAYIFDQTSTSDPKEPRLELTMSSPTTGIRLKFKTNQHGVQIYTAKHQNGSNRVKKSQQGGESDCIQKFGGIAIEPQDWIDGINHPEWRREKYQLYGPEDGAKTTFAEFSFDTV